MKIEQRLNQKQKKVKKRLSEEKMNKMGEKEKEDLQGSFGEAKENSQV